MGVTYRIFILQPSFNVGFDADVAEDVLTSSDIDNFWVYSHVLADETLRTFFSVIFGPRNAKFLLVDPGRYTCRKLVAAVIESAEIFRSLRSRRV